MLLGLCLYGIWQYKTIGFGACSLCRFSNAYQALFTSNPIPAGVTLLCLFAGPMLLFVSSHSKAKKIWLAVILSLGIIVIILLGQRAALFSVLVMVTFLGISLGRPYVYPVFISMGLIFLSYLSLEYLPPFIQSKLYAMVKTPIFRIELFSFSIHVFKESPLMGIGVWSPLEKYLFVRFP